MLTAFWSKVGSKLADRWLSRAVGALLFWGMGVGGVAWRIGIDSFTAHMSSTVLGHPVAVQGAILIAALVLVGGSAVVVAHMTAPVTRLLEGYGWPFWLRWVRVARTAKRVRRAEEAFQLALATQESPALAGARRRRAAERVARLDLWLRNFPAESDLRSPVRIMPTGLGNTLRAAETRPADKYGLDAVICWPRLWLSMPETARKELTAARAALDGAIAAWCWGMLFVLWTPWQPLALPTGLGFAWLAYRLWAVPRARAFGDLVEAAFDVHRESLYDVLRWPKPANPAAERVAGEELTAYLWRGSDRERPMFEARPASFTGDTPNPDGPVAPAASSPPVASA